MRFPRTTGLAVSVLILEALFLAPVANAFSGGVPSQPPGSPPYGMNIQGAVSGTKLKGIFQINFSNPTCSTAGLVPDLCAITGNDLADGKATLRLRKGTEIHTFLLDFLAVPYGDIPFVQTLITEDFKGLILEAFFGITDPAVQSNTTIYLKSMSEFSIGKTINNNATSGFIVDPNDPGNKIVEWSVSADVVVAVNK